VDDLYVSYLEKQQLFAFAPTVVAFHVLQLQFFPELQLPIYLLLVPQLEKKKYSFQKWLQM
jgi:hypothetical protein